MWGAMRWFARLAVVLVAIPLVLTPVYLFVDPVSVPMLQRYVTGQPVIRQWRDIGQISDRLKASVILSEDGQFCRHWGVDFSALRDEVTDLFAGKPVRGASTITMQVARNLFLWNGESYIRKGLEIPLALYVDLVLPKRRIMEISQYRRMGTQRAVRRRGWRAGGFRGRTRRAEPVGRRALDHGAAQSHAAAAGPAIGQSEAHCGGHRGSSQPVWRAGRLRRRKRQAGAVTQPAKGSSQARLSHL
jgi:hypothetical protein